jgi:hypothetical protein
LKPDVCRRVVGRLPSPRFPLQRLHATPVQRRRMAPPLSSSFLRIEIWKSSETAVVYLVRTLGLVPEPFNLTTGTFNLVVKDRTALRLSGAHSVQADSEHERERSRLPRIRLSSKPYKVTRPAARLSTHCAHRISTCFPQSVVRVGTTASAVQSSTARPACSTCEVSPKQSPNPLSFRAARSRRRRRGRVEVEAFARRLSRALKSRAKRGDCFTQRRATERDFRTRSSAHSGTKPPSGTSRTEVSHLKKDLCEVLAKNA